MWGRMECAVAKHFCGTLVSGKRLLVLQCQHEFTHAGEQYPGYGISAGKQWKLRASVNYALAAGKIIQV